tara:strand:+ start:471 stop:1325 length:855 start_codon:yes stop_codon:yes gene_type:complete
MLVFKASEDIRVYFKSRRSSIGLVPTMGALHQGHISLVKKACKENKYVVVSIYINPTQFNDDKDLEKYPVDLTKDQKLLSPYSNQIIIYSPEHKDLYPKGTQSNSYNFGSISKYMEGAFRPGHFNGVATVVEALFKKIKPNRAYFGEKDFQQFQVIKALNKQKRLGVKLISCPIVREKDGLAMSSRNKQLTSEQRVAASEIYKSLQMISSNQIEKNFAKMKQFFIDRVERTQALKVEYFCIALDTDLIPRTKLESKRNYRVFVAVLAEKTRLIDTVELKRMDYF